MLLHLKLTAIFKLLVKSAMSYLGLKWIKLVPKGTNPGIFQTRFQNILLKSDLKESRICPFLGNLAHFGPKSSIPVVNITLGSSINVCGHCCGVARCKADTNYESVERGGIYYWYWRDILRISLIGFCFKKMTKENADERVGLV